MVFTDPSKELIVAFESTVTATVTGDQFRVDSHRSLWKFGSISSNVINGEPPYSTARSL